MTTITWIPASIRLPDDDATVLVALPDGTTDVAWVDQDNQWRAYDAMPLAVEPLAWAAMPEGPRV